MEFFAYMTRRLVELYRNHLSPSLFPRHACGNTLPLGSAADGLPS
jgi:hypothetical protein